jgi:hypothetical protein
MGARAAAREPRPMKAQALIVAAALASPASAAALPTVKADLPCYSPGQPVTLTGAGYTPGGQVALMFQLAGARGNNIVAPKNPLTADPAGGINAAIPAPDLASDNDLRETVTLTANDQAKIGPTGPIGTPEESFAATRFLLTDVSVRVVAWYGGRANPRAQTTFKVYGWEPLHKVYAHYFLKGKRLKTVELGSVSGPCGDLSRTLRQFPFRPVPPGRYTIRFSPTRVFDPDGFYIYYRDVVVPKAKAVR